MFIDQGHVYANSRNILSAGSTQVEGILKQDIKVSDFKYSFMRKDPPVDENYINASVSHIQSFQKTHGEPTKLLLSFHGIPKSYVGDDEPYQSQCIKTAELIAKKLNLSDNQFEIVFQSRFGKAEWIQPYLAERLEKLPNEGIKDIQVYCPGFSSDCLETIEEIGGCFCSGYALGARFSREDRFAPRFQHRCHHIRHPNRDCFVHCRLLFRFKAAQVMRS